MKVISVNLNGIRSAWKKGFQEWLKKQDADVTCLQEIRIQEDQLTEEMRNPDGMTSHYRYALKKGYAGVGIFSKNHPDRVIENWLEERRQDGRDYIICGDWNIAHKQIDLKNWKSNQKNSGFLPEEREWMTKVFDELGYVDVFRQLNQEAEQYTWWSNRGQAWAKNVGWRLDYQVASPGIAEKAIATSIFKDQRFSDHAPLIVEYDNNL